MAEAQVATSMGHEASIVCWDRRGDRPARETFQGIPVRWVRNTRLMRWLPGVVARNPLWWRRAAQVVGEERPDLVLCHDLDTLAAGVRIRRRAGVPLVYDATELYYYMIEDKVPRPVSRAALALERRLLRSVDHVLVVDDPYVRFFRDETPYRGPITKVMNAMCRRPTGPWRRPKSGAFTLFYAGSLTPDRMVLETLDAAQRLGDIQVVVAGGGTLEGLVRARAAQFPNLTFLGTVAYDEVLPLMRRAHVVPAMTDPSNVNVRVATSVKQFEAMAAGRPVLATRGTLTGQVAQETESGLVVDFSSDAVADGLRRLRGDAALWERLARNAYRAAKTTYNWDLEAAKLREVYASLLPGRSARRP